jgi:hypothetical protein
VGLRGENDAPMVRTVEEGVVLTERIVAEQRRILADEVNPDVTRVPQLWSLYKEVQNYYERGLRVPDDITLLWAEDNWGNIRRLPTPDERRRSGGAGVYYHFDYHGGPRSYQWIDTNPIPKIAEQMSLAKQYGADRIWIVNVGHFKAYTFPMEYFLALAWDTDRWTAQNTAEYTKLWAAREFGPPYAGEIAEIVATYTKYNGRRKPELLDATTYSLVNYREAERVVADYNALVVRAEAIYEKLPAAKKDAFYQLALFPAKASANVNEMYVAAARNALYAAQGRASTNDWGDRTKALFQVDADLMTYFNTVFAGGKWNHFMDQPHIGYTSWRDPPANNMDAIRLTELTVPAEAGLGVSVDGSEAAWPAMPSAPAVAPAAPPAPPAPPAARGAAGGRGAGPGRGRGGFGRGGGPPAAPPISAVPTGPATLPRFDALNRQDSYIDVFNRGRTPYQFSATPSAPWIVVSQRQGTVEKDVRLDVSIDWTQAPVGTSDGTVMVRGAGREVVVALSARKPAALTRATLEGFAEGGGYVSMEAEDYARRTDAGDRRWVRVDNYGHTRSAMATTAPADAPPAVPGQNAPSLEYQMYLFTPGEVTTRLTLGAILNFAPDRGVRLAVSFDDEAPQLVTVVPQGYNAQNGNRDWEQSVRDNARFVTTTHTIAAPGYHTLKVWMVDPAVVLQKIVVNTGDAPVRPSYLGPPAGTPAVR